MKRLRLMMVLVTLVVRKKQIEAGSLILLQLPEDFSRWVSSFKRIEPVTKTNKVTEK